MSQIALTKVATLLRNTGAVIRQLTQERDEALAKVASFELDSRCQRIASEMHSKGLEPELSLEEKVAHLKEAFTQGKLDAMEQAVRMTANQGFSLAKVAASQPGIPESSGSMGETPSVPDAAHPLVMHILGGE